MTFQTNHRIIATTDAEGAVLLSVHEVYYNEAGAPVEYSDIPAAVDGHSLAEMREVATSIISAFERPALTLADFPQSDSVIALTFEDSPVVILVRG